MWSRLMGWLLRGERGEGRSPILIQPPGHMSLAQRACLAFQVHCKHPLT